MILITNVCMYVCVYVFIKLHITTQSGPVILVILCHSHYVCMCVCMYVFLYVCMYYVCMYVRTYVCMYLFIKLHTTTQSGPVIPSHSMPLALILPRGDQ